MSLVQLGVLLSLLVVLVNLRMFAPHIDGILGAFAPVALLGAALAVAAVVGNVTSWRWAGPVGIRLFHGGVALLGILFSLSLGYWRLQDGARAGLDLDASPMVTPG